MYFYKSVKSLVLSIKALSDWRFWLMGLLLALFGASFQGFEFFRLHDLTQVLSLSLQFKVIYLLWTVFSWTMSLLVGSFVFPAFVYYTKKRVENIEFSLKDVFVEAKTVSYKYLILLFAYYNMLFIIAGGGFLVAIAGLINNIFYGKGVYTIFDLTGNIPLVASFITIGIIASAVVSLLFSIVTPLIVIEKEGVINSIVKGMKIFNVDLPYILSAWIVVNIATLVPLILLSLILHIIEVSSITFPYSLLLGGFFFLLFFTPIVSVTNMFWAQIYMNITGRLALSNITDRQ